MGESEDIITYQLGPDLEELLLFLEDKFLQLIGHVLDFDGFFHINQILKSDELGDIAGCGQVGFGGLSNCRNDMKALSGVLKDILDDFLHKDAIVSLSSHTRVCATDT